MAHTELPHRAPDAGARRRRALWSVAVLWTVLVGAVTAWSLAERTRVQQGQARTDAELHVDGMRKTLGVSLRQLSALPANLARRPAVREVLALAPPSGVPAPDDAHRARLRASLLARPAVAAANRELQATMRDFELPLALVLDRGGTAIADGAGNADSLGVGLAERAYFTDAMARGAALQFLVGRVSRAPGLYFASRVDADGRPLGVVVVKQDTAVLSNLLGDGGEVIKLVTDPNGVVVLGDRPGLLLRRLPPELSRPAREPDWVALYRTVPALLPWTRGDDRADLSARPVMTVDGVPHAVASARVGEHALTAWVLAPLPDRTPAAAVAVAAAALWLAGLVLLWAIGRRLQALEAALHARRELSELAQALPLTAFRYEQPHRGAGRFVFVGAGVERVLGVDADALQADPTLPWRLAGDPAERPPTEAVEFKVVHAGRRTAWVRVHSVASAMPGTTVYNGYWLDVTDRRDAETRFKAVFEHAPSGYLFFDRRRGVTHCNAATLAMFGATTERHLRGRMPWFAGLSPPVQPNGQASRERALEFMRRHFASGERVQSFEWRFQRADGEPFDADVSVIALSWEGEPQFCAVITDVSERKRAEAAMHEARAAAEAASRTKSNFLANMSHELRTPMNAIIGMTHLALADGLPPAQRDYVAKAHASARDLLRILDDILDVSKVEAGRLELERIVFRLEQVIDDTADVLALKAEGKGLELLFSVAPEIPTHLVGDPVRLRQVMLNLGSNAIKFTDRGEVTIGVETAAQDADTVELHVRVHDTGIGLTPQQQSRIFQPFIQGDDSTTRRFGGTGLGLTISRELVERMGGRLWVESAPGAGSTFHFTARFGRAAPGDAGDAGDAARTREAGLRGLRALVVDANPASRAVLARMLDDIGVSVEAAAGDAEALERLGDDPGRFAWILVDCTTPGIDGAACMRRIVERDPAARARIVLMVPFGGDDTRRSGPGFEPAAVLRKPVTPSALRDALRRVRTPCTPDAAAEPAVGVPAPGAALRGARILLVEDQPLNQELARELLRRAGADVVVAADGEQALARLDAEGPFDGVLMDCQMPVMDGYTATRRLREDPRWRHLPVIAMTASALAADRERALASGMNAHITKPLDVEQMFRTLAEWIGPAALGLPAPAPLPPEFANLRAIDARDGCARCLGNAALYRRLLAAFAESAGRIRRALDAAVAARDWGRAGSLAHELKGLAGNVGARSVHAAAAALQAACEAQDGALCARALAETAGALAPALAEIEALAPAEAAR